MNPELEKGLMSAALSAILDETPDMMFLKDANFIYMGASHAFAATTLCREPSEVVGKTDFDLFADPELARRYRDDDQRMLQSGQSQINYVEPVPPREDGRPRYASTTKLLLRDEQGRVTGIFGHSRDITGEYEARLSYERELRYLFDLPEDTMAAELFDVTDWRVVNLSVRDTSDHVTSRYERIDSLVQEVAAAVVADEAARRFFAAEFTRESLIERFEQGQRFFSFEYLRRFPGGESKWVRDDLRFMNDPVNGHLTLLVTLHDVDEAHRAESELVRAAQSDAMTGLLNRDATMRGIRQYLCTEGAAGTHALFMIDVDNFKNVNDTFGHQTGDEVLIDFAGAIRRCFRDTDLVGRIGGDEFFALMKNAPQLSSVRRKARELVEALQYICCTSASKVELSGSVGVSLYHGDGKTLDTLYSEADAALYQAKQKGKNVFAITEEEAVLPPAVVSADAEPTSAIHLRTLLENMDGMMVIIDTEDELRIVYVSPSSFNVMRRSPEEIGTHGERLLNTVSPEDMPALRHALLRAGEGAEKLDHTYRTVFADGHREWRHIRGGLLPAQSGEKRRLLCIITDIDAFKRTEADLREKSRVVDFAMENTDVNLWFFDVRTKDCVLSENCKRVHGIRDDVLHDFPEPLIASGYVREDSVEPLRAAYRQLCETGDGFTLNAWLRKRDGLGWWCERINVTAVLDEAGRPVRGIGIGKDMTAVKALETSLRAALDDNPAYIYVIDPATFAIAYANRAIRSSYNRALVDEKCYAAFLNRDTPCVNCPIRTLGKPDAPGDGVEILRPDGMWVLAQASPLLWDDRQHYVLTCTDITRVRRRAELLE